MGNEHTSGPWIAERVNWRNEPAGHEVYISGDKHECEDGGEVATAVCVVEGNATSQGVTAANARLIVAAPELLAACEAVLAVLVEPAVTGSVGMREMREWFARLIEARTAVRAAISRATGGDPP